MEGPKGKEPLWNLLNYLDQWISRALTLSSLKVGASLGGRETRLPSLTVLRHLRHSRQRELSLSQILKSHHLPRLLPQELRPEELGVDVSMK